MLGQGMFKPESKKLNSQPANGILTWQQNVEYIYCYTFVYT